jgi:hypothetical protein
MLYQWIANIWFCLLILAYICNLYFDYLEARRILEKNAQRPTEILSRDSRYALRREDYARLRLRQ